MQARQQPLVNGEYEAGAAQPAVQRRPPVRRGRPYQQQPGHQGGIRQPPPGRDGKGQGRYRSGERGGDAP
jgi:hypothetical protein